MFEIFLMECYTVDKLVKSFLWAISDHLGMRLKIIYFSFAVAICLIAYLIFRFRKQKNAVQLKTIKIAARQFNGPTHSGATQSLLSDIKRAYHAQKFAIIIFQ